jgi:hypothetical protein
MSIELKIKAENGSDLVDRVKDLFETFFKPEPVKVSVVMQEVRDDGSLGPETALEKLDELVKEAVSIVGMAEADLFPATDQVGDKAEPKKTRAKKPDAPVNPVFDLEKDLRPRTKALVAVGKITELKALFERFGCDSVGKLKPDQFADFMSESEKLL